MMPSLHNSARDLFISENGKNPDYKDDTAENYLVIYSKRANLHKEISTKLFKKNLESILNAIPSKKLEDSVLDALPEIGILPISRKGDNDKYDKIARMHSEYIGAKQAIDRYTKGEANDEEESRLLQYAGKAIAREKVDEIKKSIKEKYDIDISAGVENGLLYASEKSFYMSKDRDKVIEYGMKALEQAKGKIRKSLEKDYSLAEYGRDMLKSSAKDERYFENAMDAVARLGS